MSNLEEVERQLRSQRHRLEALQKLIDALKYDMLILQESVKCKIELEKHKKSHLPC